MRLPYVLSPVGIYFLDYLEAEEMFSLRCTCREFKSLTQVVFKLFDQEITAKNIGTVVLKWVIQVLPEMVPIDNRAAWQVLIHYVGIIPKDFVIPQDLLTEIVSHPHYLLLIEILSNNTLKNKKIEQFYYNVIVDEHLKWIALDLIYFRHSNPYRFAPETYPGISFEQETYPRLNTSFSILRTRLPISFRRPLYQDKIISATRKDMLPYAQRYVHSRLLKSVRRRLKYERWHINHYNIIGVLQEYLRMAAIMPPLTVDDLDVIRDRSGEIHLYWATRAAARFKAFDPIYEPIAWK